MVRNEMFRRVELFADENAAALGELDGGAGWDANRWEDVLDDYFDEHNDIGTGPDARGPGLLMITEDPGFGRSGRFSTIRRATMTGASPRKWTWRPQMKPVRQWSVSPTSTGSRL
ncbi:atp-Dependent helicase [Arthrobacter sp. Hiyo4]|nr:atp-Dependent helicase [Arthrobacter sp. Hiyo4]